MFFKRARQDKKKAKEAEAQEAGGPSDAAAKTDTEGVNPQSLGFETTAELEPADGPIGQSKALDSLAFGAGIRGPGYNILVTGSAGSGCRSLVRARLESLAAEMKSSGDWVYVSYFDPTGGYRALKLPPGSAHTFADAVAQAIDRIAEALPAAFAADDYDLKRRAIEEEFRFSREDALEALRREAEAQNIALLRTPAGIAVAPILEGKVVRSDVFNSVPESLRREVHTKIAALEAEIEAILAERPEAEKARRERLLALNEQVAGRQVRAALEEPTKAFADVPGVERYLKAAGRDLVRNAGLFLAGATHDGIKVPATTANDARFARYRVHVMSATGTTGGLPVIEEMNPTYANLFGRIELGAAGAGQPAQVVRIKPGVLHRACGGFLLLDAGALVAAPAIADALTRALEAEEIRFDPPTDAVGMVGEIPDLEPMPLGAKLVVFGDKDEHRQLAKAYPRLKRHFKVEAVFDEVVERSPETIAAYARAIAGIIARNELKPLEAGGVALLIDEAGRKAGGNGKLSLEIGHVADICREADHWAKSAGRDVTAVADVERVLQERKSRAPEAEPAAEAPGSAP